MRNTVNTLALSMGMLFAADSLCAQTPIDAERLKAAEELQQSIGADAIVQNYILAEGPGMVLAITKATHLPIGKAASLVNNVVLPKMMQHKDELEAASPRIYAEHFTAGELAQVRDFYTSGVGQKLLRMQGEINVESQLASQKLIKDVKASVIAELQRTSPKIGTAP